MEAADIRPLLQSLGMTATHVEQIGGGWASDTFAVDDSWIIRVARTAEVALAHRRERRLLPELAGALPFAVPEPRHVGEWRGRTYLAYAMIPGRELQPTDDWLATAGMLRALHDFPTDRAADLLGIDGDPLLLWRKSYVDLWQPIQRHALPLLDPELRAAVTNRYETFLDAPLDLSPTLVHGDLGTEHILVPPGSDCPAALIDFEDATVGDPAIDFGGLLSTLGPAATERIIAAYGRPVSWPRLWFYWWMGSMHAVLYGVRTGDYAIVRDGVTGLRERLAALPRLR
jgi:aminoglycoside phosphotransferase (APT) family kinase protein